MDDDGKEFDIDEVEMQDVVDLWATTYAEDIEVQHWYYDPAQKVLLVRLVWDREEE